MGLILGSRQLLRWNNNVNATFDGNSLVAGVGASSPAAAIPADLSVLAPISGAVAIANLGVNGRPITSMTSDAANVDSKFAPGKTNVLFVLEGTNSIAGGKTAQQCYSEMTAYCARVLVNPWKIVLVSTPPFSTDISDQALTNDYNARVDGFNALMKANYRAMGAAFYVDLRDVGSVLHMTDYTPASFNATPLASYWDGTGNYRVHFNDAGYAYISSLMAASLRRLPAR